MFCSISILCATFNKTFINFKLFCAVFFVEDIRLFEKIKATPHKAVRRTLCGVVQILFMEEVW